MAASNGEWWQVVAAPRQRPLGSLCDENDESDEIDEIDEKECEDTACNEAPSAGDEDVQDKNVRARVRACRKQETARRALWLAAVSKRTLRQMPRFPETMKP